MDIDVVGLSDEYKQTHSIGSLGRLLQFLKLGNSRSEVEELLGKPTTFHPFAGSLYDIADLRAPVDVGDEQSGSMPVFLQVDYEGDEQRRQAAMDSGDLESAEQGQAPTDKLLAFAILPIGE
jgi:hypothetical protein